MIIQNGKIIQATEMELYSYWLANEMYEIYSFWDYYWRMKQEGVKVVEEKVKEPADIDPAWSFDRKELGNGKNL